INNYIVHGRKDAVNLEKLGTKASAHYPLTISPGESKILRLRLSNVPPTDVSPNSQFGNGFDRILETRRQEADEFYPSVIPSSLDADAANVMRQALAGML